MDDCIITRLFARLLRSCFHSLSAMLSHVVMLFLMTYNIWVVMSAILGSALGFYFGGPWLISGHGRTKDKWCEEQQKLTNSVYEKRRVILDESRTFEKIPIGSMPTITQESRLQKSVVKVENGVSTVTVTTLNDEASQWEDDVSAQINDLTKLTYDVTPQNNDTIGQNDDVIAGVQDPLLTSESCKLDDEIQV